MNVYHTGFAIRVDATLYVNNEPISPAALTVTATITKQDRTGLAAGTAAVTCTKPGGDIVRAEWTAAQTATIVPGTYLVEFRTNDGPYCHEGVPVEIRAGVAP